MNEPIKPLVHNRFTIAQLHMVDGNGVIIQSPYRLKPGINTIKCIATYIDGIEEPYKAVWTCPEIYKGGRVELYGMFGAQPREDVGLGAGTNHGRYLELVCWAWHPQQETPTGNSEIPHFGITFDYSDIN